jgi:hypothetical protein
MTVIVVGMVLVVLVALVVLSVFSEEDAERGVRRVGGAEPDEGSLDDLLH